MPKPILYPAHGWLPPGAHLEIRRDDQGKDIVTNWRGPITAPGSGLVIAIGSDAAFPFGFGPSYPIVHVADGPFGGHYWYIGHTTAAMRVNEIFHFGDVISHADQGLNFDGTHGGWVELGEAPGGMIPPAQANHWFDHLLETPLAVTPPFVPMRYSMKGLRILGLSSRLRNCGYLSRPYMTFNSAVHGAVVAFKTKHHIHMPPIAPTPRKQQDRGVVDERTDMLITSWSDWCQKHHKKDYP